MKIPFNTPPRIGTEATALSQVAVTGSWAGDGPHGRASEALLAERIGAVALLTTSASHALEMMALALDLGPGDEVIVPSYTFVTSASAFTLRRSTVVFADCDASGQICLAHVAKLLSPRTRAVLAVHYAGYCSNLLALGELCAAHGVALLEDGAQAFGGTFANQPLCSFGSLACLSFHETKNLACGEGGALLVGDARLHERALEIRDKGTNRHAFRSGRADKYTWRDQGSSYVLGEFHAAVLRAQLSAADSVLARRVAIVNAYRRALEPLVVGSDARVSFLERPQLCGETGHMSALVFADGADRTAFIARCADRSVQAVSHYVCLHESPFVRQNPMLFRMDGDYEGSRRLAAGLVRLPVYFNMTDDELAFAIAVCSESLRATLRQAPEGRTVAPITTQPASQLVTEASR